MRVADVPDSSPYKCRITGQSDPSAGPYLKLDFQEYDAQTAANPGGRDQYMDVWISEMAVQEMMHALGIEGSRLEVNQLRNKNKKLETQIEKMPKDPYEAFTKIEELFKRRMARIEKKVESLR